MRRCPAVLSAVLLALPFGLGAAAQQPELAPPQGAAPAVEPTRKPRPKPKPAAKPDRKPASAAQPVPAATDAAKTEIPKPGSAAPATALEPPAKAEQPSESRPGLSQGAFAAPVIACDPGKAVLYDGPKGFSLWVTRTGTVTVENPLRPLTPVVTRVLLIVIGDRQATAYGPDLGALRRGGAPGALEATLGGAVKWDAALGALPDPLAIVGESGEPLAEMRFKECGDAPAVKAAPVAKTKKDEKGVRAARRKPETDQAGAPARPQPGGPPPRRFNLPQGALPE